MTIVSIIGTAGRGKPIPRDLFLKMVHDAKARVQSISDPQLRSGGAAYSDHIAVCLHKMQGLPLDLHLPSPWDETRQRFKDNGGTSWRTNPGRLANFYHEHFSQAMGTSKQHSLQSLHHLFINKTVKVTVHNGFHARNIPVSQVDIVLAYTWGTSAPPPGGTAHTWKLALQHGATCHHVNLATL